MPSEGVKRLGPSLAGPSSISLPGLKLFPTSRVGPSLSVDRKHDAERLDPFPRREFQFPDLRLKSTRRLAEWRTLGEFLNFFLKLDSRNAAESTCNSYQHLQTRLDACRRCGELEALLALGSFGVPREFPPRPSKGIEMSSLNKATGQPVVWG